MRAASALAVEHAAAIVVGTVQSGQIIGADAAFM